MKVPLKNHWWKSDFKNISSVDVSKAAKAFPNQLMLNIALQDELPKWLAEMKEKYDI